jgi:hypothetical protein
MLLVGRNLFMGWSTYLILDIQWTPSSGENWGVVTSPWTRHQTWWTSVPDRATCGLEITDWMPPFKPSWSMVFDRIVVSSSCVASFFIDVTWLVMCSVWKDHPMASIFVFWWTSVPDRATCGLQITDWMPPFKPSWSMVFDRIVV